MQKIFLTLFLMIVSQPALFSGVASYFKLPQNKSGNHSMKNVDFIYTINLDQRPEKFAQCVDQLKPYGIDPYRFSAVNGWELTLEDINELGIKFQPGMPTDLMGTCYPPELDGKPFHELMHVPGKNYFSHCLARGPVGIVLSHCSILQDAINSNYNTIWVMEDDIEVIQNPNLISSMIKRLDQAVGKRNWDILFTDQDTKDKQGNYIPCRSHARRPNFKPKNPERFSQVTDINKDFRKIGARYGAYSMIIRKSGMKKILDFIKQHKIFLPYDMEFYLPDTVQMYAVKNDIVSTLKDALSDNGGPRYKDKLQVKLPPTPVN